MALGQNLALVNIKIAGKWVFTPLTLIIIGFDTHTHTHIHRSSALLLHVQIESCPVIQVAP